MHWWHCGRIGYPYGAAPSRGAPGGLREARAVVIQAITGRESRMVAVRAQSCVGTLVRRFFAVGVFVHEKLDLLREGTEGSSPQFEAFAAGLAAHVDPAVLADDADPVNHSPPGGQRDS